MRTAAWLVGFVAWFSLVFGVCHWYFGSTTFVAGAVYGAMIGLVVLGLNEATRRGWLRPLLGMSHDEASKARAKLAKEREDILATARAKAGSKVKASSPP